VFATGQRPFVTSPPHRKSEKVERSSRPLPLRTYGLTLVAAAAAMASYAWSRAGGEPGQILAAWVIGSAIVLWASGALPEYLTALFMFFLAVLLGVAPPEVVFSGFHSSAVWLVFGGLVLGLSVQKSGLGDRAVAIALNLNPGGYRAVIWSLCVVGLALAFVVPSAMGRVMLMVPIVLTIADRLGFGPGSAGRTGMVLAVGMGTTLPAFAILPSNVPNMALMGATASIYGLEFRYGDYLALNFTVMGLLSFLAVPTLICRFFASPMSGPAEPVAMQAWSGAERRLMVVLAATVALWATDFAHGISPAWIALGAGIICLLPRWGIVAPTALASINFGPWLFVAGVIGLGAIASHTGLAASVGAWTVSSIDLGGLSSAVQYALIVAMGMVTGLVASLPASPAIMTPLAQSLADAAGWPLHSVLMAQVPSWIVFAFPFQAPPLLVALSLGGIRLGRVMPVMLAYFGFGVIVMLPLHFLWARYLGVFP